MKAKRYGPGAMADICSHYDNLSVKSVGTSEKTQQQILWPSRSANKDGSLNVCRKALGSTAACSGNVQISTCQ